MAKKTLEINTDPIYEMIKAGTEEVAPEEAEAPAAETQETQEAHEEYEQQETSEEPAARKRHKRYTEQEIEDLMRMMKTSGRKDLRLPRINLAFSPEVYQYVSIMSRVRGETMTSFINAVIKAHKESNKEKFAQAMEFRKTL